ncbi:MAG: PDZ domain-containing protein [Saprospiraceae bacterium]
MRIKVTMLLLCMAVSRIILAQDNVVVINNYDKTTEKTVQVEEAYLGVSYSHINKSKAKKLNFATKNGAYITRITEGSAAQKIGLQAFDYLIRVGDKPFSEELSFSKVMDMMKPNQSVEIEVIRDGKPMVMNTVLTTRPEKFKNLYAGNYAFLGITPSHNDVPKNIMGTRVDEIVAGSTADVIGMEGQDIVMMINDNPILDWHDVGTALKNTETGKELKVVFYRESEKQTYEKIATAVKHGNDPIFVETEEVLQDLEAFVDEVKTVTVDMVNVTQDEADDMLENMDIEMPIDNNLAIEDLRLFPNPNNGIFNLNFNLEGTGDVNIRIYAADGRVVYEDNEGNFTGDYLNQINISDNAQGIYFLMVRQGEQTISKKILLK